MTDTTNSPLQELAAKVKAEHLAATAAARKALEHALDCGDALGEAKSWVPHGGWGDWLKQVGMAPRTARLYMQLARKRDVLKTATVADLTIRTAAEYIAEVPVKLKPGQLFIAATPVGDPYWRFVGLAHSRQHEGFVHTYTIGCGAADLEYTKKPMLWDAVYSFIEFPKRLLSGEWDVWEPTLEEFDQVVGVGQQQSRCGDCNPFLWLAGNDCETCFPSWRAGGSA